MEGRELESRTGEPSVLDRMPFNLTQLLAFAMQKPRDPHSAMESALAQLRATPQFASKAYYSLPFKRTVNGRQIEEVVEGPSIKAATALTGCWGNNLEGGFLGQETEDYVDVFGYFFDYETGKLTTRPWRVSKVYRGKDGKMQPWRYDMLQKQIMAGVSKAIRNADLNGLPAGYVAEYFAEAKRIAARGGKLPAAKPADDTKAITEQIQECCRQFAQMGIDQDTLGKYMLCFPEIETEEQVAAHLIGVLNALEDQQTTIEELFGPSTDVTIAEPQRASAAPAPVPPPEPPKRELPKDRRRQQAKFDGATCSRCKKAIRKGDWLWKDGDYWVHEADGL